MDNIELQVSNMENRLKALENRDSKIDILCDKLSEMTITLREYMIRLESLERSNEAGINKWDKLLWSALGVAGTVIMFLVGRMS